MGTRVPKFLLLFGPTLIIVGLDLLSNDVVRGSIVLLAAPFLTIVGSYYQWLEPKKRSKLWLLFPGLFSVFGYLPLVLLKEKSRFSNYFNVSAEFYKSFDVKDHFTLVAMCITKYYLELIRNYRDRLKSEVTLLATAGILDAQINHSLEQKVSPRQILNIAKNSVLAKEAALVDFIINFEIELFQIDAPEFDISEIKKSCFEKRNDIEDVVQKVQREYAGETDFASATSNFMKSLQFKTFRQAIGISD
ncbi:hypothetical protein ACFLYE_02400 [Chloroflexota bacterium]